MPSDSRPDHPSRRRSPMIVSRQHRSPIMNGTPPQPVSVSADSATVSPGRPRQCPPPPGRVPPSASASRSHTRTPACTFTPSSAHPPMLPARTSPRPRPHLLSKCNTPIPRAPRRRPPVLRPAHRRLPGRSRDHPTRPRCGGPRLQTAKLQALWRPAARPAARCGSGVPAQTYKLQYSLQRDRSRRPARLLSQPRLRPRPRRSRVRRPPQYYYTHPRKNRRKGSANAMSGAP